MNQREDKAFPFPKDVTVSHKQNMSQEEDLICKWYKYYSYDEAQFWKESMSRISVECEEDGYKSVDWIYYCYSIVKVLDVSHLPIGSRSRSVDVCCVWV